ncbi:response regulator transcription factor [Peribacillus psychrosaccharolyticus]|uniref:response regulator n=1 Tax=Peribacillus psychrosaccharolyticus TaxID=1407 RepID=UPI0002EF6559|nr:response regulator transcription factor [Peribacillus psychrosaccharolyticus]MEC2057270.1 response regulator transcription factor [Peribacillus psychrosaccharolyticus]MED3742901.1 response regulator transcription factor [Peribacillus psychrosaccharolyticus]
MKIRLILADDHHIVRKGLVLFLGTHKDLEIIGEAENGLIAIELAKTLNPDIILMDLSMPILDGIEATKAILAENPEAKIMILTSFSDKDHVIPALEAGASGYQFKDSDPDQLVTAIRSLYQGEKQLDPKVTSSLLTYLQGQKEHSPIQELTKREKEVLKEITLGKSNKEIAAALFITEKTVKTHISNILSKLCLQDRTQAALYAVRNGLDQTTN